MTWLFLALFGVLYAQLSGYWIHRAIHTRPEWFDKKWWRKPFKFVSTSHMGHHALGYGVRMIQAPSRKYYFERNQNEDAVAKKHGFLLLEFTVPAIPFVAALIFGLYFFDFSLAESLFCIGFTTAYVIFFFLYVHDAFHKFDHWLGRNRLTSRWFLTMRNAHWRHHFLMNKKQELPYNNGISSPLWDAVFGTWKGENEMLKYTKNLGQVTTSPHSEEEYEAFYAQYNLQEPKFDQYLEAELRRWIK